MNVSRAFPNILADDLPATRDFYVDLLGFRVAFDSDWFVNLASSGTPTYELGIWRRDHELVPVPFQQSPAGCILSFIVDDVDAVHADAVERGLHIVAAPRDLFYGQRQMLLTDPAGALVDVSTPGTMDEEFVAQLVQDGDTLRHR